MTDSLMRPPIRHEPLSVLLLNDTLVADRPQILAAWLDKLDRLGQDYELLLAISDETLDAAVQLNPKVRTIPVPRRQGVGDDLREGVAAARHSLFFYTDCTQPFAPGDLSALLDRIDAVDLVSGYHAGGPLPGWLRRLGQVYRFAVRVLFGLTLERQPGWNGWKNWWRRWWIRLLFGVRLHEPDSPFRLFRKAIFARIPVQSHDDFAHVEIVAKANFLGCLMDEVPLRPRSQTTSVGAPPPEKGKDSWRDCWRVLSNPDFGPAFIASEQPKPIELTPAGVADETALNSVLAPAPVPPSDAAAGQS